MKDGQSTSARLPGLKVWARNLAYIIKGHERQFWLCLLLGLVSNAFVSAANPLALKYLFDEGIIRGDFERFVLIGLGFVLIFTFWRIAVYFYRLFGQSLKNAVIKDHSLGMLNRYFDLPYREVARRDRGYFLSRIYDEVATTSSLVMDVTLTMSTMAISLIVALGVAISISYRAALFVLIAVPIVYGLSRKYGNLIKRESKAEKEQEAGVRGILERAVGAYKPARLFGLRPAAINKVEHHLDGYIGAFFSRFRSSVRYETLSGIFMSYVETIAIVSAGYEILRGRMTFGGFMGFMSAFWGVMGAVRGLFGLFPELARADGQIERLLEFEQTPLDEIRIERGSEICLDQVDFLYDENQIFRDLVLVPKPGERILVMGPNGSGKSTLAHLISGLLEPTEGTVHTLPWEQISTLVAPYDFVPGTVADNLRGAKASASMDDLVEVLGLANLREHDPGELSAGQRKRLEIAMVLSKPANLYILDEPLAGIDVESKAQIIDVIMERTAGQTLIVILHGDIDFHCRFDRHLVLDAHGSITHSTAQGVREPLVAPG